MLESDSEEEESGYVLMGMLRGTGVSSGEIDVKGEDDDSGGGNDRFRCSWRLARCRVIKGSETVGVLRVEGSLTDQLAGGEPGGSRLIK